MIKPITIKLKSNKFAQLKRSIMCYVADEYKADYQDYESTVLKGFRFKVSRGKTIRCIEI